MSQILDLTEDLFCKEEWIGKGLIYPKDPQKVDLGLAQYCQSQLEVPIHIQQNYFPHENLTIEAFLIRKLPNVIISLVAIKTTRCFCACSGLGLRLSPQDFQVFERLTKVFPDIVKLMKAL